MRTRRRITENDVGFWAELYESGLSCPKIARIVDRDPLVVWRNLKKAGIELRDNRKYAVNELFFDSPLSSESQRYWLGFIIADGVIRPNMLVIKLALTDRDHLYKFKKDIKSNHPVKDAEESRETRVYYSSTVSIGSAHLVRSLAEYGVIQHKVHRSYAPKEFISDHHFWRGLFDGDGGFNLRDKRHGSRATLTGSEAVIIAFRDFIHRHTRSFPSIRQINQTFSIEFGGNGLCQDIAHILYDNSTVYLDRKMAIAKQLFSLEVMKRNVRKGNSR